MPENPDINPLETEISFISNPEIGSFELNSKVNSERFVVAPLFKAGELIVIKGGDTSYFHSNCVL